MCRCAQLQTTGMTYFRRRSPPLKEEESAAPLLTERPGCRVCHSGSVMSPLTRKERWPDYRGRPESQKVAPWDSGSIWGRGWEPPWRGAGRQSGRSRSLARSCKCSGWPSKQAWRGVESMHTNRKSDQVQASRTETCNSLGGCFLRFQLNQTKTWSSKNSETTPPLVKHERRQNAALQSLRPSAFPWKNWTPQNPRWANWCFCILFVWVSFQTNQGALESKTNPITVKDVLKPNKEANKVTNSEHSLNFLGH